ncbi:MAG: GNAT family N-acetyltransferase [Clostridia bacterium]|nr:GNAT family N-acetyltransferase [Clostridia bacterium]
MIMGKYFMQGDDLAEPFAVRRAVFVQELGLPESAVFDGADGDCIHALAYDDDKQPVAAGRLRLCDDGTFWIGYVAVLADKRRRKLGDFIVRLLLDRAFLCGAAEIFLTATPDSTPFFESIGFSAAGEKTENGVPMSVRRGQVKTACGEHHEPCPF